MVIHKKYLSRIKNEKTDSGHCHISKMELFPKAVNCFCKCSILETYLTGSTVFAKCSILEIYLTGYPKLASDWEIHFMNIKTKGALCSEVWGNFWQSPLKMMKNAFYFTLKAPSVLKIFKILSWLFGHVGKQLD